MELVMNGYDWVKPKKNSLPEFFKLEPALTEKKVIDWAKLAPYKVEAKVINILGRGICATGHEIGDTFLFEGNNMKVIKSHEWRHEICDVPVSMFQHEIARYMWGGYLPDARGDPDNKVGLAMCNDLKSLVIFQLKRIKNIESPYWKETKKGGKK